MKFLIVVLSLVLSVTSFAQDTMTVSRFNKLDDQQKVAFLNNNAEVRMVAVHELLVSNDKEFNGMLEEFARAKSEIWMDTILEGDFAQLSAAAVTQVNAFIYRNEILAYQIEISAPAYMTASEGCLYNEDNQTWTGSACVSGKIVEKALANTSFESIWSSNFPEFIE